jgi:hypothetical protein
VSPKWKSLLARVSLVGGIALVSTYMTKSAPHEQKLAIRCGSHDVRHLAVAITAQSEGDDRDDREPMAGFAQDFPRGAPSLVHHTFSAPNGTYIVVITFSELPAGDLNPIPTETTFERRVSLVGGEVIVSPD